jgi:hypothetical protein
MRLSADVLRRISEALDKVQVTGLVVTQMVVADHQIWLEIDEDGAYIVRGISDRVSGPFRGGFADIPSIPAGRDRHA